MRIIELSDYTLPPIGSGHGIHGFSFTLATGDVCAIDSESLDDAHCFLRALATLITPLKGTYIFKGDRHDLRKYGDMLCCKQKIGYVAPDAALISNITIRQNLLLTRFYHENRLDIDLKDEVMALCETFQLKHKLNQRPAELNAMEIQAAIVIRELAKQPEVLLLAQPEDFIGHAKFDVLGELFNDIVARRVPVVFLSFDRRLVRQFANRKILITKGALTTVNIKRPGNGQ